MDDLQFKTFDVSKNPEAIVDFYIDNKHQLNSAIELFNQSLNIFFKDSFLNFLIEENELYENSYFVTLAYYRNKLVGFTTYSKENRETYISSLWVLDEYRRHGIGSALVFLSQWNDQSIKVNLMVPKGASDARCFYRKLNFKEVGQYKRTLLLEYQKE